MTATAGRPPADAPRRIPDQPGAEHDGPPDNHLLLILAADHRDSLEHDDAIAVAAMAGRGGRQARCIADGRHAPHATLDHWLKVTAPIPGWAGFSIGHGIWWDPLRAHLRHHSTAGQARRRMSTAYLNYALYYLRAREGTPPRKPESAL